MIFGTRDIILITLCQSPSRPLANSTLLPSALLILGTAMLYTHENLWQRLNESTPLSSRDSIKGDELFD